MGQVICKNHDVRWKVKNPSDLNPITEICDQLCLEFWPQYFFCSLHGKAEVLWWVTLTTVIWFIGAISTIFLSIALPQQWNTSVVCGPTSELAATAVSYTSLVVIGQQKVIGTCTGVSVITWCNQTKMWTATVFVSTWIWTYKKKFRTLMYRKMFEMFVFLWWKKQSDN